MMEIPTRVPASAAENAFVIVGWFAQETASFPYGFFKGLDARRHTAALPSPLIGE